MVTHIRNRGFAPFLETEGVLVKPLHPSNFSDVPGWYKNLSPFERVHNHHTLASVRRHAHFHPHKGLIPQDELDFVLSAHYDHGTDTFQDRVDVVLQPETVGIKTWRQLSNVREVKSNVGKSKGYSDAHDTYTPGLDVLDEEERKKGECIDIRKVYRKPYNKYHPVRIGGIVERRHPSNIKLMNSYHHSPQTNAGYSRKEGDGTCFEY